MYLSMVFDAELFNSRLPANVVGCVRLNTSTGPRFLPEIISGVIYIYIVSIDDYVNTFVPNRKICALFGCEVFLA